VWSGVCLVTLHWGERHVDAGTAAMVVNIGPAVIAMLGGWKVLASFDGGLDWHRVRLVRIGGHWLAAIHNPAKPGYVSLWATAADSAQDTVTQTIIRAYAVTG